MNKEKMQKNILLLSLMTVTLFFNSHRLFAANIDYYLSVEINPDNKMLYGKVEITPLNRIKMNLAGLQQVRINGVSIKSNSKPEKKTNVHLLQQIELKAGIKQSIEYQYPLNSYEAYSDKDNVVLSGSWYPQIEALANYHLTVNLPEAFKAISEADQISSKKQPFQRIEYQFSFAHLLDNISLVASTQYHEQYKMYQGIRIESWFKQANAHLSASYIEHAIDYLTRYQKLLGKYPYQRFAMLESPLPSGYSMPSYTLLGSQVIALPFIVKGALAHEVLHQWFGNSVYIDYQFGNWAEGLTTYLADYYAAEQQGNGADYRKGMLRQYSAYVNKNNRFAVNHFVSRKDKSSSAIGYGKVAMIFHQLSQYYGRKRFLTALQAFIHRNRFTKASWHDLQREFELLGGKPLYQYFSDWLTRKDIPAIEIKKTAKLVVSQGKLQLNFSLTQSLDDKNNRHKPYQLHLPLVLYYPGSKNKLKKQTKMLDFNQLAEDFSIDLDEPPSAVFLDPDYHLMRQLDAEEKIPDLAWLMGKKELLLLVSDDEKALYQSLVKGLGVKNIEVLSAEKLNFEKLKNNSFVIAGENNLLRKMLFDRVKINSSAQPFIVSQGTQLSVKRNPYNDNELMLLLTAKNQHQALLAAKKIAHYGKYSQLEFIDGLLIGKQIASSERGIKLFERIPSQAIKPSQSLSLDNIVEQFKGHRSMLVGEQHDLFEHHINQLLLIKKLQQAGYQVAIGMEMFQTPYQPALDAYSAGKITESEFLTQSQYFEKWRYDYNLYKPIIDYAVAQKIPLVALNIDADLSHKVVKKGMLALSEQDKQQLPKSMNFENRDYRADLKTVFKMHQQMQTKLQGSFSFFLQAQSLWDETMAQTAATFLQDNPHHILVILAGNGHLRYRYGIADRLQRLTAIKPLVIVQDEDLDKGIADYVLLTTTINGNLTPKLGLHLETDSLDTDSLDTDSLDKDSSTQQNQLMVKEVIKASVATKAGIEKGDIILSIDGKKLATFSDLKLSLMYADSSQVVPIKIKRKDKVLNKFLDFNQKVKVLKTLSH